MTAADKYSARMERSPVGFEIIGREDVRSMSVNAGCCARTECQLLRAAVGKYQFACCRLVTHLEQVLDFRVAKKRLGLFAFGKLDDDQAFGFPITFDGGRLDTLNEISAGMLCDERRNLRDILFEASEIIHRQVEHQIRFHAWSRNADAPAMCFPAM